MKKTIEAMAGLLGFLVGLPITFTIQYLVYKHIQAPEVVWTLWVIHMPLMVVLQILQAMAKSAKE